ncbi:MAG: hypothetical protein M1834_003567 [Cirrosporium novae-zelandiae]|nr:MAG: hypothetical protein M1834_003567 [Cirrosporium novae-zelandiae]
MNPEKDKSYHTASSPGSSTRESLNETELTTEIKIEPQDINDLPALKSEISKTLARTQSLSRPSKTTALDIEEIPIDYHYLEHETELPIPIIQSRDGSEILAEEPDLRPYTSPFIWPKTRKNVILALSCIATGMVAYAAGAYSTGEPFMSEEWGLEQVAVSVGITTFTTGFAVMPMVLAPFSELNGRKPVFLSTGLLFLVCQIACAFTHSYAGMIVARFFVGAGASTFSTMVGGIISDMYHASERNTPMVLFSTGTLFGTGLGPVISGVIVQHTYWRWLFYVQIIMDGVVILLISLLFKETRGSVLLSRKAKALNGWYEAIEKEGYVGFEWPSSSYNPEQTPSMRIRWKVKADEERESLSKMIAVSLFRPFHLLFTEPVVFFFSLWAAFSWAVLYMQFTALPLVFGVRYGFNNEQCGAVFTATCIGALVATTVSIYQERLAQKYGFLRGESPEERLYFSCIESALLPIGLFWFGWTCFSDIPWIVPALAIGPKHARRSLPPNNPPNVYENDFRWRFESSGRDRRAADACALDIGFLWAGYTG